MKNIIKYLSLTSIILFLSACEKQSERGNMIIKLTDDPADYLEANVEVVGVRAHYDQTTVGRNGWIDLVPDTGVYNLLELQNNVTAVIATGQSLPLGHVTQMRLILGTENTVITTDSLSYPLLLSSQDQTGLKLNLNAEITANHTVEIVLDFDANASVVEQGNGDFRLKPVIAVESVTVL